MSLLSVENLSLDIHGLPILRDVSLSVAEGEIHGLIGESGSGKSMTAFAVMQLLPNGAACRGRITLAGRDVLRASDAALDEMRGSDVGMVFQEPQTALNPVRTIGDQVAETVRIHRPETSRRDALAVAAETLERCELPNDRFPLTRYPHELSGGQKQRVVIAMAIALRPALLVADEPTTALDVTTQAQVLNLLTRLAREDGMGMLLITHDLAVVSGLADRLTIMRRGEVVETGETRAVLRARSHPYTRDLLAASTHRPKRRAAPRPEVLLEVRDAVRDYTLPKTRLFAPAPTFRAVDGVSFDLHAGESLGLVGESGCGKSTLTRAILGLEDVQGGTIRLGGLPVFHDGAPDRAVRRRMQAVFQDPYGSFDPRWRVERIVTEPFHLLDARPSAEERGARAAEALEQVGLAPDALTRYPHEFSGGQRQRIAIARALVLRPDLIVLDEAVSALDVSVRARILDLLAGLSDELGLAYLFISHDLSVVRSVTDRVLVMKAGRIVEAGATEEVLGAPSDPYTRALVAASPTLDLEETHAA